MSCHGGENTPRNPGNESKQHAQGSQRQEVAELQVIKPENQPGNNNSRPDTPAFFKGTQHIAAIQHLFANSRYHRNVEQSQPQHMISREEMFYHFHLRTL